MHDKLIYDLVGWLALILNIWGNLSLAKKSLSGWLIRLSCNVAFIIYSIAFNIWPLLVNHIIFAGINIYGWFEWSKSIYTCKCGRVYDLKTSKINTCICELPINAKNTINQRTHCPSN